MIKKFNMFTRKKFIQSSLFGSGALLLHKVANSGSSSLSVKGNPVVVSTWESNIPANEAAWSVLSKGGRALDAVVAGVQVPEADPDDNSVGYGGLPDRDGRVTLDSCVMDELGNCGSVMALEYIMHPVLVARLVMEKTPHVQIVGEGALEFALANGFKKENLITEKSEELWKEWLKKSGYHPTTSHSKEINGQNDEPAPIEPWPAAMLNHDTIGMVALDTNGNLGGACSTSGLSYKMRGRVGDSPIIGAGLFVDNEVGAATATGVGEEVVKICGSHTIIESMRHGMSPKEACKEAVRRILKKKKTVPEDMQVGFIAINNKGEFGSFAIRPGFTFCITTSKGSRIMKSESWFKEEKK